MNLSNFSLKKSVAGLEDGIIVLSGPALAISGIIAGVDLVTGGNILKSMWWLSLVWAITLLLTLDFQVLCLGVRSHRVCISDKSWQRKAFEIGLAMVIAAAISYVSVQMQSVIARVNAENISIDVSAAQLGINTIALIWERSALVLVLIFMSGWFREHKEEEKKEEVVLAPVQAPIDIHQIVDELDSRMTRHIEAVYREIEIKIDQAVGNSQEMPAITPAMIAGLLPPPEPGKSLVTEIADQGEKPIKGLPSYGDKIEALWRSHPGLSALEIATSVGCSVPTASKWKKRLEVPGEGKPA